MSALPSSLRSSLEAKLAALDEQLAPAPAPVLPLFSYEAEPEDPTVSIPLRAAVQALAALRAEVVALQAAARSGRGSTDDRAADWYRAHEVELAVNAVAPVVDAAVEENRRRRDEWRAENARRRAGQRSS